MYVLQPRFRTHFVCNHLNVSVSFVIFRIHFSLVPLDAEVVTATITTRVSVRVCVCVRLCMCVLKHLCLKRLVVKVSVCNSVCV